MDEMKWFGLIVRGFGLAAVYLALNYGAAVAAYLMTRKESFGSFDVGGILPLQKDMSILATVYAAVGVYLLRGAPGLVRFCYPRQEAIEFEEGQTGD